MSFKLIKKIQSMFIWGFISLMILIFIFHYYTSSELIVPLGGGISIIIVILFTIRLNKEIVKREKVENELLESREYYRTLTETLPQTIFEYDLNGKLTYANQAGFVTFKYTPQDLENGLNMFQMIIPEDRERAKRNMVLVLNDGKQFPNTYTALKKDGTAFPILVYSSAIMKFDKPAGVRGILIVADISEIKKSEELLKQSESRFRILIENSPLAIAISVDNKFIYINEKFEKMFGYTDPGKILGSLVVSMIAPDYRAFVKEKNKEVEEGSAGTWTYESYGIRKDRSIFPFQADITKIEMDNKTALISFISDITERVNDQRKLNVLSRAIHQSPVSVMITNSNGDIEYVNPKFTEISGYTADEVSGKNPRILQSKDTPDGTYKNLWDKLLSGRKWEGEFLNKRKNGEFYWESAVISPVIDDKGKIIQFVAVKEDITDKKKFENDLIIAKEKAESANRLKSNFLANMSHELRTPLVGVLGYSEILLSELNNPDYIEMVTTIKKSGERLNETLNSILDLSMIESDKQKLNIEIIDLKETLEKLIFMFLPSAKEKKLYLKLSLPDYHVHFKSDKEVLTKVLRNLINNAIKFTYTGGVTMNLTTSIDSDNQEIHIAVMDSGIGIPEEFQHLVFEPFRQVSEGSARKFEGSGLGLSLVRKFVELLGGSISISSIVGKGSTFSISFPLTIQKEKNIRRDNKFSTDIESKLDKFPARPSILLVEDDAVNASVITVYLNKYFSVEHILDGNEAISMCKTKTYDAILMDINLKGIDGIETLKLIRRINAHYSQIPIISLTAYAMAGDKEKFLSLGFNHYLSKPFQRSELLEILFAVFKRDR